MGVKRWETRGDDINKSVTMIDFLIISSSEKVTQKLVLDMYCIFSRDSDLTTANLVVDILFNVVDILCNVVDILKKLWIYYIFNG